MSQTVVKEQDNFRLGQKYGLARDVVMTYAAEEKIIFGRFTALGTDKETQVKLPAAAADVTALKAKRGVALHTHAMENVANGEDPAYLAKTPASIMTVGQVVVEVEDDVTPSSDVYVRHTADAALDQLGIFAPAAGTGLAALANARFLTNSVTVEGRKLAVLELL